MRELDISEHVASNMNNLHQLTMWSQKNSREGQTERSTSRTYIRIQAWAYKKESQSRQDIVVVQSVLCEDALCVKITVIV